MNTKFNTQNLIHMHITTNLVGNVIHQHSTTLLNYVTMTNIDNRFIG